MTADPRAGSPTVSVITIFRDEERFLAEAIDSVLAQTGVDWELVLIDDGSADDSPTIARRYAAEDPDRIRYLTHPGGVNRGMSASRNLGMAGAAGRWLTFLDADDVWRPAKLAAQLDLLDQHPGCEILVSPAQWWRSWNGDPAAGDWVQPLGPDPSWRGSAIVVHPPALVVGFLTDEWQSICDLVISRRAAEAVGGFEPAFRAMFEDQVFHAKVLARFPAVVTSQWWYRYRQHDGACTATSHAAGDHGEARRRYLDWLHRHLRQSGVTGGELDRLVRRHRRRARHPLATRVADRLRRTLAAPAR